jgi:TPR repeat protein
MSKLDKYEVEKGGVDWFTLFFRYELAMRNLVKDPEGAFKELQYTANKSWPKSFYNVGYCYSIGRGITQDTAKAINFYQLAWAATKNDVSAFNMAVNMCELDDQLNAMRIFEMIADSDTQIDFIRLESIKHCYHYFHNRALNNLRGEDMLKANRFEALAKKHSLEIEYD